MHLVIHQGSKRRFPFGPFSHLISSVWSRWQLIPTYSLKRKILWRAIPHRGLSERALYHFLLSLFSPASCQYFHASVYVLYTVSIYHFGKPGWRTHTKLSNFLYVFFANNFILQWTPQSIDLACTSPVNLSTLTLLGLYKFLVQVKRLFSLKCPAISRLQAGIRLRAPD